MDMPHALLARNPLRLLRRQQPGGKNKDKACFGFFCRPIPTPPKTTSTVITRQTTSTQPKTTSTTPAQTPKPVQSAPVTTNQATSPVIIPSNPPVAASTTQNSPTLVPTASNTNSGISAQGSQSVLATDATGIHSQPLGQSATTTNEPASYSVFRYLTTDSNGYTIDATSTSFINSAPTSNIGTTNSGTDSTESVSSGSNVGPIVGGAVGAISFILLVLFAIWAIRRRRRNRTAPSSEFITPRAAFGASPDSRFRQLDDYSDAQSISEYPFEPTPPSHGHGGTASPRSFLHVREKSDAY